MAISILRQIASGMQCLHAQRIMHRSAVVVHPFPVNPVESLRTSEVYHFRPVDRVSGSSCNAQWRRVLDVFYMYGVNFPQGLEPQQRPCVHHDFV